MIEVMMPPKIRQLKAELRRAGFFSRPGKGSHTVWTHPAIPTEEITIAGHDGDDAQRYQGKQVRDILKKLRGAK
jgi:predicted RNA binding protein YcfA (HicA-like mRNA interferase family)